MIKEYALHVNGENVIVEAEPTETLLSVLRTKLGLTGAKEGCGQGECGACTILVGGRAVDSCLMLVAQVEGRKIITIEGLSQNGELDILQRMFIESGAIQCGYCTPGMIMSAKALLLKNPHPGREEIKTALSGNLCRCTGYAKIIDAVDAAANRAEGGRHDE